MAGGTPYFDQAEYPFPKPLIEIGNTPIIQKAIQYLERISGDKRFIFLVQGDDCSKFHLDSVLKLLTDGQGVIIKMTKETRGAACSALMAIDHINNDEPLLIMNYDQIIEEDINTILSFFQDNQYDAGVVTFETIHPRWSYVRLDNAGNVVEAAEKRPISKNGIAGCYYFRKGSDFVDAVMKMIRKDSMVNGSFYVAPCLNEMVLANRKIGIYPIDIDSFHTFYTPQKIKEYEEKIRKA